MPATSCSTVGRSSLNEKRPDNIRLAETRRHIEAALRADEESPEAHYYMARYWKAMGRLDECRNHLETAVSLRDNYIDALRELRLMKMREGKGGGRGKSTSSARKGKDATAGRWPFGLDKLFKRK